MPIVIDNIELDETNFEFNQASELVRFEKKLIYLTGKAGTGKTTFLKYLKQTTNKNTVILAPTGVAAINAGGQTINSFFQIKPSVYVPNDKRLRKRAEANDTDRSTIYDHFHYFKERIEIINGMELLIIDEISMVRCDLLDVIDNLLRVFRKREFEPFGGVQVILIGDTFQLPPVIKDDEWEILNRFYNSHYFFDSKVIKGNKPIYIELKKIYRQKEQEFIELLNKVRINQITQNELTYLNSKHNPTFTPNVNDNYITLATHNNIVDSINSTKLAELTTELKLFEATITGIFPDTNMPTNRILELKEGAQIMLIKNTKLYYNGTIGKVKSISENKIKIDVKDSQITVERETWKNIRYSYNVNRHIIDEETIGTFTQFPIKLAWAITVHKSQGLTFEKVFADLGGAFASGQVYVALSRCTSFNGLVLKTRIERTAIKTNPQVLNFAQNETPSTLIVQELNTGKADFYYKKSREAIKTNDFSFTIDNFTTAIKYRNDLETEIFKRYFIATLSRLNSHKKLSSLLTRKLEDVHKINFELQERELEQEQKVKQKNKINEQLHSELLEQTRVLTEQIDVIRKQARIINEELNTKYLRMYSDYDSYRNRSAKEKIELIKRIEELTQSLEDTGVKLNAISQSNRKHFTTISDLQSKLSEKTNEIERLKNIKWYQKLLGA